MILIIAEESGTTAPGLVRPSDTGSDHCRALAARWIWDCVSTHEKCRDTRQRSWLPTRLIDVGHDWPAVQPKLVVTSQLSKQLLAPLYTSLSHLWSAESVFRLTIDNQHQLMQAIPLTSLSPTFRDAILFTRQLGIRYLWIDSLCILQGSSDDWKIESALMNKVYKHSVCNIAATSASEYSPGLYQRRDPRLVTPYRVRIRRRGHNCVYIFSVGGSYHHDMTKARLNSRRWVFQERMLSLRTLHFSSQLLWECRTLHACETYPAGFPRPPVALTNDIEMPWPNPKLWIKAVRTNELSSWNLLVQSYCRTQLSRPTDRLAAIAGLAQEVQVYTKGVYLAGLWKEHLPYALCWSLWGTSRASGAVTRPDEYRCKSLLKFYPMTRVTIS